MRVSINLASRPYLELGPIYLRLRILIGVLAILSIPLFLMLRVERERAAAAHARLAAVQDALNRLQTEERGFEIDMRRPPNAAVLRQSQFLNALFAQKAFSWTAVMMDLEDVLPAGVQVMNIDPVIDRSGRVTIRLRVSGQHDRAVDLVRNLEHSHRFLYPRLAGESAENSSAGRGIEQASAAGGVDFDILAEYNPLPLSDAFQAPAKSAPLAGLAVAAASKPATRGMAKLARPRLAAKRRRAAAR